ncbi:diguanylate cyclase domain-containing protein [Jidongwangia harbinensis]|uniref:diguanylate cyclase domain-containing protein n=1 Tax=Jidongwangia harbinensis TaxID=2878561 RepID=UPI001CDA4999|nr:GGDEF domain-containing protein [Jidongwangia harbinensis]MCA2216012.1 GGDEF domain-containing protein [Jidongwangia harbinensis]
MVDSGGSSRGGLVLGALSPFLGGWYFGGLLEGIAQVAADAGAAMVAVQTLDAGTDQLELIDPPHPPHPLAWEHATGFVVILNAASAKYLHEIQATGRPVVVISHDYPELDCPTVFPDNRVGTRAAVEHLIRHGHRRIAFAGFMGALDQRERYETYRQSLLAHGIAPDPDLLFEAVDNQEAGGEGAAHAMLTAGMPSTAVLAGTDLNAIGMIRVLSAAGCRLPEDQAIVGFDDLSDASFSEPRLTTVRQSLFQVGSTAAQVLLSAIDGTGAGPVRHQVATHLVVRESCGCPATEFPDSEADAVRSPEALRAEGRSQYRERTRLQRALSNQYDISLDLLRSHEEDPRQLGWLRRTSARAGCLGLWTETPGSGDQTLDVVGHFHRAPHSRPGLGATTPLPPVRASGFPPVEILNAARAAPGLLTFVVPVRVRNRDWGLLATVDRVDLQAATGREPINQWAALLTVALDYQAVLQTLREQEEQLRESALYDHLTGLPNRGHFLQLLAAAVTPGPDRRPDVAVLFVDLDGFKLINDTFGHAVGDRILVEVAARLRSALGGHGTAGRFGGDEFLVLLDALDDGHTPVSMAHRLQSALNRPHRLAGQQLVVTASIGVALAHETPAADAEALVRDADTAMYWAKSRRSGGQAVFEPSMHDRVWTRLRAEVVADEDR